MTALALHTLAKNTPANTPPLRGESWSVWRIESIFQREIANILTRANKASSLQDIAHEIGMLVKQVLNVPWDITLEISPRWEVATGNISFSVSEDPALYLHISGIPEQLYEKTRQFLKSIKIQIKNAIDAYEENYRDELTWLYNRKFLTKKKATLDEKGWNYGIMYFDIVGLSLVNNKYGHAIGNELIKQFSQALKDVFWEQKDVSIIRHGWDEFIVIISIPDATTGLEMQEQVDGYARILQKKIQKPQQTKQWYSIDAKIGASMHVIEQKDKNSTQTIREADPKWKKSIQKLSQALPIGFFDTKNLRMRQIRAQIRRFLDENVAV